MRHYHLKYLFAILFFSMLHPAVFSQDTGNLQKAKDTPASSQKIPVHKDSVRPDSPLKAAVVNNSVQPLVVKKDSVRKPFIIRDSSRNGLVKKDSATLSAVAKNITDSLDSLRKDSLRTAIQPPVAKKSLQKDTVQLMPGIARKTTGNDIVFYILIFLLFFLGLVKTSFPKYVNSIFGLSFQVTFRQTQTKEQMEQNFFPAFMLNVLFVLCGGLFITLFAELKRWSQLSFWELFVYATAILLVIYFAKYIVISFTGWVFNVKDAASEYRFVVFFINKVLAILMIPFLFLIAYSDDSLKNISVTIVICLSIFALFVRYLVSLARIRKNLSVTAFHFFIYLCAVEIVPLLVIYKILFLQTSNR